MRRARDEFIRVRNNKPWAVVPRLILLCNLVRGWSSRWIGKCQWPPQPEGVMGDEGWSYDTEVNIDDEDIDVGRKFRGRYSFGRRAKDQS